MSKDNTNLKQKLEAIKAESLNAKINLLKSVVNSQGEVLKQKMIHFIKKTLCDKSYPNALNKKDIEIQSLDFDFETLEIIINEEEDFTDTSSIFLLALITVNGDEVRIGAWITIDDNMKLNQSDFNIGTAIDDIDCNFNHGNIVRETLNIINNINKD
jgi:hypothetical protein